MCPSKDPWKMLVWSSFMNHPRLSVSIQLQQGTWLAEVHTVYTLVCNVFTKILQGMLFMQYACGKQYCVCMTCEWCPYWCPIYITLFWYILGKYWYVLVCTIIYLLYRYILVCTGTSRYRYALNTLFLYSSSQFQMILVDGVEQT